MIKKKPGLVGSSFDTLKNLANSSSSSAVASGAAASGPTANVAQKPESNTSNVTPITAKTGDQGTPAKGEDSSGYPLYEESRTYKVGERVLLPLDLLEENPRNPRVFYFDKKLQELVASLAANGQLETAQVYPINEAGRFRLKSGHRRRLGLQMLNQQYIKVEVVAPSKSVLDEYKQARAINIDHQTHTHLDDALRFSELIKEGAATDQTALAVALNISKADMSKSLSIAEMPRAIIEPMAEHIEFFGLTSAYNIFRFWKQTRQNEERTLALVRKVIEGRLSVRALESLVKEATAETDKPVVRREHALARAVFKGAGEGELKSYAGGKLTLELSKLAPECRDQVYSRILSVFKELGISAEAAASPGSEPMESPTAEAVA